MKKTILLLSFILAAYALNGQTIWQKAGDTTKIYYNNGKVGIGTSNPLSLLQLYSNSAVASGQSNSPSALFLSNDSGAAGVGGTILFSAEGTAAKDIHAAISSQNTSSNSTGSIGNLIFSTKSTLAATTLTPRMLIKPNGNVGIGTTDPYSQLEISGYQGSVNSRNFRVRYYSQSNQYLGGTELAGIAHISGYWTAMYAKQGNATSAAYFDGNVGIGTPIPGDYKLAVKGKIRAEEIKVETGWSDFVFSPTYNLKSLTEVEQYIKTNKHLPDIPSAAEVEENGINLGEMDSKLLQKIEELTLYLIEMDKENENQAKLIERLNEKIEKLENNNN